MNKLAKAGIALFIGVWSIGGSFAMDKNILLSCNLNDPGAFLPADFADQLCVALSTKLGLRNANSLDANSAQERIILSIVTLSNHSAKFVVYSGEGTQADVSGEPTHGPYLVESMDAGLQTTLPSHLQNDLKRLLGL